MPEVALTGNNLLAIDEYGASADDLKAAVASCVHRSLTTGPTALSADNRAKLRIEIDALKITVAKAVDAVARQIGRLDQQETRLKSEQKSIGLGTSNYSKFHGLAVQAISACDDVAAAAQKSKESVDFVFSRQNEVDYRVRLVVILKTSLTRRRSEFESAMVTLNSMANAII